jgi:ribonuclease HII
MKTAPRDIEERLYADGFFPVAGVDEVGRGPLAGPVVTCAIILPRDFFLEGVNDSKKISEKNRLILSEKIKEAAVCYSYGIISPEEIDEINILQATLKAMAYAIDGLSLAPKIALADGIHSPEKYLQKNFCGVRCVPKGDSSSHLIAAASILAKVKRDNIMQGLHEEFAARYRNRCCICANCKPGVGYNRKIRVPIYGNAVNTCH